MAKKNEDHQPSWITCPSCGGSGYTMESRPIKRGKEIVHEQTAIDCRQCDTSGQVRK